jgi:branched-chain amino acid transport system permease protein
MGTAVDVLTIGLQLGGVYALVALGIVLVYKATKVLNFAHGGIGSASAFLAYMLIVQLHDGAAGEVPLRLLLLATGAAVVAGAGLAVAVNLLLRRLAAATPVTSLVATIGVALLIVALQVVLFEARARPFPRYVSGNVCLARDGAGECARFLTLPFGSLPLPWHTLVILAVLAVAAALLALLFRTGPGVALLATAQDPFAARLQGVSVPGMTTLAWATAGVLAAVAGLLGGGVFNTIQPGFMLSTFLVPGFTAAVLGGITSMVGAVAGGLLLGMLVAAANQTVQVVQLDVPGAPQIAVLAALLLVLFFRPRGLLGREA